MVPPHLFSYSASIAISKGSSSIALPSSYPSSATDERVLALAMLLESSSPACEPFFLDPFSASRSNLEQTEPAHLTCSTVHEPKAHFCPWFQVRRCQYQCRLLMRRKFASSALTTTNGKKHAGLQVTTNPIAPQLIANSQSNQSFMKAFRRHESLKFAIDQGDTENSKFKFHTVQSFTASAE